MFGLGSALSPMCLRTNKTFKIPNNPILLFTPKEEFVWHFPITEKSC